jgi:oligosaccharide reducing-end xylanase
MKGKLNLILIILIVLSQRINLFPKNLDDSSKKNKPNGAYYTGIYKNLFIDELKKDTGKIQAKLDTMFNRYFYGDDSTQRIYYPSGSDMAYIEDIQFKDVRTEGMSYGMMIALQMNKKNEFDRLWKWAKTYMQHSTSERKGYFAWHCDTEGKIIDSSAAPDGEEWFVMSLFFASARWGNGEGIYNYKSEAQSILDYMLEKESRKTGKITNMFNKKEKQVVFVPSVEAAWFTDPSYHLPHYYELWSRWADKNKKFWCDAAKTSREFFKMAANPRTGLMPDYANFDGTPLSRWNGGTENFQYDAWRCAMNMSLDYSWFAKDKWEIVELNKILEFFHAEGIGKYGNIFTLDGKKLGNDHSVGLIGMNAVGCISATSRYRKEFLDELWNSPVPSGAYRYYDGMLYMLSMLQVSGNFKIYDPTGKVIPDCHTKNN